VTVAPGRQRTDSTRICKVIAQAVLVIMAGWFVSTARAQDQRVPDSHAGHQTVTAPANPSSPGSDVVGDAGESVGTTGGMSMDMGSMQGGSAPPDARDPNAYADGYDFGPYTLRMADTHSLASLLVDRLETARGDNNSFTAYDLQAWYGRTYDRAVLKAEGDIDSNKIADARTEALWGHAVAAYWDTQLGVRYDSGEGPNRGWLAFGVQGLAPYWFEVDLTGYLGEEGRTALRLDTEYELLLTQKLILQPRVEANAYGKSDTRRSVGSGLSDVTVGLRLRYEIRREFAPYVGVEWARNFGETQDLVKDAGEDASETRFVAGLRFWF